MVPRRNQVFELRGINHMALVCKDMARTVDFYTNVLGMPLIKTLELPNGMGQHFFFDCGGGASIAFFWFANAPKAAPGIASAAALPGQAGDISTAHGSMNHLAFDVPADKIEEYHKRLVERGVEVTQILNHDDSESTVSKDINDTTFVRSLYFYDPDGIVLEFAAWTREFNTTSDIKHTPARADGKREAAKPTEYA